MIDLTLRFWVPTPSERKIIERRRASESGDILRPILERLFEEPVEVEDQADLDFLEDLFRARMLPREKGVFSPSMLGACERQAYFAKTGVEKLSAFSARTHGYFATGNFLHAQWQFALWKAHRKQLLFLPVFYDSAFGRERHAVEVRVRSKGGSYAGTTDGVIAIGGVYYLVDFKGLGHWNFQAVLRGDKEEYAYQLTGYATLFNSSHEFSFVVKNGLLILVSKAATNQDSPLFLHEIVIPVDEYKHEVRQRLENLLGYVKRNEVPPPACTSTRNQRFEECPFSRFCGEEVRAVQQKLEQQARSTVKDWKPARVER